MAAPTLPGDDWLVRRATAADVPALAALYAACARDMGPAVYSPAQVAAWASFGRDTDAFRHYVLDADTWLLQPMADPAAAPDGFCGAGADGEVHSLYVRPALTRRGLGSRLLGHVLEQARQRGCTRFAAWVTPFSRPVFGRAGFRLVETVQAPYQGVMFERYRVEYP